MEKMISQIGFLSKDICNLLADCGETSVLTIKTRLNISNTMVYLSLGWLLREGKVFIKKNGDEYLVGLEN